MTRRADLDAARSALALPAKELAGRWYFRDVDVTADVTDSFDRLKSWFKRFPRLYYFLIGVIAPVHSTAAPLARFRSQAAGVILNIGSGNQPRAPGILNVDMIDYDNVDIVCDIHRLPFKDGSIDAVMSVAVLEHVQEPARVIQEVHRVLKPGGRVFTVIPFMQPFHASPHDYQRYTLPGIRLLHRDFDEVESGVLSGPMSAWLWVTQEFIASVLSLGIPAIRHLLTICLMLVTWPLKYLDVFFLRLPTAQNLASNC